MMWLAILALAASDEPDVDGPPPEWVAEHAPYGFDITPRDGKVWINMDRVGDEDDYAVLANDFYKATGNFRYVWVRGYHRRNPKVRYRETITRVSFTCDGEYMETRYYVAIDANRKRVATDESTTKQMIVPGTYGDQWKRFLCEGK